MSRQAQVGAFAILALILAFGMFYVITDFGTRHTGYRIGVHFNNAAGLQEGSVVYFSGVSVGTVEEIQLLPDNTIDVILAVNRNVDIPRESQFLIQAPLTGSPALLIVPPRPKPGYPRGSVSAPEPALPHEILPVAEQPQGTNAATIADLLEQGQGEIKRLDMMLADLQEREPRLLGSLQQSLDNANKLTQTADQTMVELSGRANDIADSLTRASNNIVDLTGTLNTTVGRNSQGIDSLVASLNRTAVSLNQSMDSLRDLATNKQMKSNIVDTTQNIADLTLTLQQLASDLRTVTGNPTTQGQLRDTVANVDAAAQKANSLLGTLGGTSRVYGVDQGATPYPLPSGHTAPAPPQPQPHGNTQSVKRGLGTIVHNLYAVQLRVSGLSSQTTRGSNPLLSKDRGPQTDINLVLLPRSDTSFMVGANDIGARSSYNFAAMQNFGNGVHLGGGVLYSRLGVLGTYDRGRFGVEGRAYDLRRPTLDFYGNFNLTTWAKLFLGERDSTRAERRTTYGLQLQF